MTQQLEHPSAKILEDFSPLLEYPSVDYKKSLQRLLSSCRNLSAATTEELNNFQMKLSPLTIEKIEELYTRTFDLAPLCILYVSSHKYGEENFERGALMSLLAEKYAQWQVPLAGELPDHLSLILRYASRFSADELSELINFCLIEAIDKMIESLKDSDNCYLHLLKALRSVISFG